MTHLYHNANEGKNNYLKRGYENMKKVLIWGLSSLIQIVLGILLLINPLGFTEVIFIILGIAMVIGGILNIINYFIEDKEIAREERTLFFGLLLSILGFTVLFSVKWIISTLPIISVIYGAVVMIAGLARVQDGVDKIRNNEKGKAFSLISAVVGILCGVIIIANPFSTTIALWIFAGISLIVDAILDLIGIILVSIKKEN